MTLRTGILLSLAVLPAACTPPPIAPADEPVVQGRHIRSQEGINQHDAGPWRYVLHVRAKGARSETRAGLLYKDETPVLGQRIGETILTPWGPMRWFGQPPTPIRIRSPYEFGWLHAGVYDRPLEEQDAGEQR